MEKDIGERYRERHRSPVGGCKLILLESRKNGYSVCSLKIKQILRKKKTFLCEVGGWGVACYLTWPFGLVLMCELVGIILLKEELPPPPRTDALLVSLPRLIDQAEPGYGP